MAKRLSILVLIFCVAGLMLGCPKKQVKKDEPGMKSADAAAAASAADKEKAAWEAAEKARKDRETQEAKAREDEARRQAARKELETSLTKTTTPGIGEGTVVVSSLLKNIYFDFDRYDVRPGDTEILKANAAVLKQNPNLKIQVEGHCDERGTREYNLALGERRANSAKTYLVSLGIGAERVSTISFGKEMPDDPGHTEAAWAKNRRARFVIVSK